MNTFTPKYTIEDMQELAVLRGGRCLSKEYWNIRTKLTWKCERGHSWDAFPRIIIQGGWCLQCNKGKRSSLLIEDLHKIAVSRGGKCLSDNYINCNTKLKWQCKKGHVWEARPMAVKESKGRKGSWCPYCCGTKKLTIKEMRQIAKSKGGKCLSNKYINHTIKLKWQCKEGHIWKANPMSIKGSKGRKGSWCAHCSGRAKLTIKEMRQIAKSRGGKCLSDKYINAYTKLKWQCKKGHIWETKPNVVKNSGAWCPYCAGSAKLTIEEMHQIAKGKGGKCLSDKYIGIATKLKWQCKEGHVWEAMSMAVKGSKGRKGTWCPYCDSSMKLTIEEMRQIAKSREGKCLSNKYVNNTIKLKWQCKEGHIWEATSKGIKKGFWCSHCNGTAKLTIEEMQRIAKSRGGKCLSDKYINNTTNLKFQCQQGHIWEPKPMYIKAGNWCPYCSGRRKLPVKKFIQEQPPAPLIKEE